jgi:hypothetical protein
VTLKLFEAIVLPPLVGLALILAIVRVLGGRGRKDL